MFQGKIDDDYNCLCPSIAKKVLHYSARAFAYSRNAGSTLWPDDHIYISRRVLAGTGKYHVVVSYYILNILVFKRVILNNFK